jgi:hypothetical protein
VKEKALISCGVVATRARDFAHVEVIFFIFCDDPKQTANAQNCLLLTMMLARSSIIRTAAARAVARRELSSVTPKVHTAKSQWSELQKTRPPKDEGDTHVSVLLAMCIFVFQKREMLYSKQTKIEYNML